MPRIKVNGWRFLYRRAGKGPDVVMLPGAAHAPVSRPLFDALSADFRVTLYRARGGDTASYGSADAADDLRGLHEKLGFSNSYLVAQQDAALVALHTAVLYPDIVAGLILIEPCLPDPRMDGPTNTGSGLTTRRILMIEHPLVVLCSPRSPGLNLCRFLANNLTRCKLIASTEDPVRSAARIHEQALEMAGANPVVPAAGGRSSRIVARGVRCRLAPDTGDGLAITRWVTRLSAWGL
jgi:pimeloyl-ACP methyl ester carboxylesterase